MHRRPRLSGPLLAGALALAVGTAVVATVLLTRPHAVEVTPPAAAADPACARLAAGLPARVLDQPRRTTSSPSPAVAAWGDPAIVWRCGVDPPGPTTDECISVDGVDWVRRALDDGSAFTTYGRDPAVQVLVPRRYAPETFALPALSRVVSVQPQGEHRCS